MKNLSLILLLSMFLLGCKSNNTGKSPDTESMEKSYLELAKKELGEEATCEESQEKTYVLCKYIDKKAPPPMMANGSKTPQETESNTDKAGKGTKADLARVKYFVWNTSKGDVIKKGTLVSGSIMWHSNTELKVIETKGANLPADVYLYNVETQKMSPFTTEKP